MQGFDRRLNAWKRVSDYILLYFGSITVLFMFCLLQNYKLYSYMRVWCNWRFISFLRMLAYTVWHSLVSNSCALTHRGPTWELTSCSGTMSWPGCLSGWVRPPAPSCPAHSGTSAFRNFSPAAPADGQWRRCGLCGASSVAPADCPGSWKSPDPPLPSLQNVTQCIL